MLHVTHTCWPAKNRKVVEVAKSSVQDKPSSVKWHRAGSASERLLVNLSCHQTSCTPPALLADVAEKQVNSRKASID